MSEIALEQLGEDIKAIDAMLENRGLASWSDVVDELNDLKKERDELKKFISNLRGLTLGCMVGIDDSESLKFDKLNKIVDMLEGMKE